MNKKRGKYFAQVAVIPIVSPEDSDLLEGHAWRFSNRGYPKATIQGRTSYIHRIILQRMIGRPLSPKDICDHMNGIRHDVRRENLKIVSHAQNSQNRSRNPYSGTTLHKCGKWQAHLSFYGKSYYIGLFSCREEAAKAAAIKREELGFYFPRAKNCPQEDRK